MDYQSESGHVAAGTPFGTTETPGYIAGSMPLLDAFYGARVEGDIDEQYRRTSNNGGSPLETERFTMRSYCWCEGSGRPYTRCGRIVGTGELAGADVQSDIARRDLTVVEREGALWEDHEDACPPNFHHYGSGVKVRWYMHSGQGSTISRDVSATEWALILADCLTAISDAPAAYRVMVTGSRDWARDLFRGHRLRDDWARVANAQRDTMVEALRSARERAGGRHLVIVQGAASGADRLAGVLADRSPKTHSEPWPALWRRAPEGTFPANVDGPTFGNLPAYYRDEALFMSTAAYDKDSPYDKRAGMSRNEAMLASGVHEVVAFFAEGAMNRGTAAAVASARRRGIPVTEYRA